jgi:hypothetical protein
MIREIKSRRMRWLGLVAHKEEKRNTYCFGLKAWRKDLLDDLAIKQSKVCLITGCEGPEREYRYSSTHL